MQGVDYVPQTRTHYDPTQRAQQWKQRVVREEDILADAPKPSSRAGQRVSGALASLLPGPGSTLGQAEGAGSSARGRPDVPPLGDLRRGLRSSRSSRRGYTGRSGYSTGRSSYTGRSSAGSELSTFRSLNSNCSNLTEVALGRIERLEQSLEEERRRREKAEQEINQLRALVSGSSSAAKKA
eukprot:g3513.t1